ncbi:ABC transporter substrate-binding protein [Achromobacter kerstersii]|uniref:ABC transporter substrate-binding protein n=1 Tax=Achromobacter kerstersii TaxID=1353890 RepID=UPI0006C3C9F4|nr:ABC transporter substrate-binding protein [Achromobacter kerstersii]CUJ65674.1 leucine ABC transporter subunit substrate-binding protein LivK [Achromobacter kerstersii]
MKNTLNAAVAAALLSLGAAAHADDGVIRIGFITDMSGLSADADGPGGAEAIKMAVADMGGAIDGKKIEVLVADHQNRADIASSRAREWLDQKGVDMLIAGANSAAALAMAKVAEEKKTPFFVVSAGASELTNAQCTPYTVHYVYDTVSLSRGTARAMLKEGNKDWYFLTVDHAFGHALERDASAVVQANGGQVKGRVRHPLNTADFSSYILQAQASGATVLGLANSANDTSNAVKAAAEFGLTPKMKIAGLLVLITDIHALGLAAAQDMYLTTAWYWDQDDASRKWAARFEERMKKKPSMLQAGDYSVTTTYLNAVKATGTTDGDTIMKWVKSNPVNDFFVQNATVRADGLLVHDMYLMQVKKPAESKGPWDYYKLIAKIPGGDIYTSPQESKCRLMTP